MIFTTKMKQLIAVVLGHDAEKVTKELLRQGVLDFVNSTRISDEKEGTIEPITAKVSPARVQETRNRIESFLSIINIVPSKEKTLKIEELQPLDLDKTEKELDNLAASVQGKRNKQSEIQQELMRLEDIKRQLELFGDIGSGIQAKSKFSFLSIQTGTVPAAQRETFEQQINALPSVHIATGDEENPVHLLITMKRDDAKVNRILQDAGWQDMELPKEMQGSQEEVFKDIKQKIEKYREEQHELGNAVSAIIKKKRDELETMWANLMMNELFYKVQSYFGKTSRTVIFSGWLPEEQREELEAGIKRVTENRCYLEWREPVSKTDEGEAKEEQQAPVQITNPRLLQPFQALVENYATPEYGTVNPAPFVAAAYLIMFGLMFGDVGHGAVLLSAGIVGTILMRINAKNTTLFELITW